MFKHFLCVLHTNVCMMASNVAACSHHTSSLAPSLIRPTNTRVAGPTLVIAVDEAFQASCAAKNAPSVTYVVEPAIAVRTSSQNAFSQSVRPSSFWR